MSCPGTGPCQPFVSQLSLCCLVTGATFPDPCITGTSEPVPQAIIDGALQAASEVLWAATGRQYGKCTVKIRPCRQDSGCNPCQDGGELPISDVGSFGYGFGEFGGSGSGFPWLPNLENGVWTNISCNSCSGTCGCSKLCELDLPYPVCCIDEVKVDGVVQGPNTYKVIDFRRLVRTAGQQVIINAATATGPTGGPLVSGVFSLVGPGALVSTDGFGKTGIEFPQVGQYIGTYSTAQKDLSFELEIPAGFGGDFNVLGIPASHFKVVAVSGVTDAQITKTGSHVTVANAIYAGQPIIVSIRTTEEFDSINQFTVQNNIPGVSPNNLRLLQVQSSNLNADGPCWPKCQNLALDDTQPDTWSVTVTYGKEPPELVKLATAELACQFIKSCVGQPCMLPQRMQSISRQGITIGLLDPMAFLAQGSTGIYIVELARNTFNPSRLARRSGVYSPDMGKRWSVQTGDAC